MPKKEDEIDSIDANSLANVVPHNALAINKIGYAFQDFPAPPLAGGIGLKRSSSKRR